ncbi:MAG: hypothetical protein Q9212_006729, partial [Teloschistes hypoglaucus]
EASVSIFKIRGMGSSYKSQKRKVGESVYRPADQEIVSNIDASTTKLRGEFSSKRLPEFVDRNALKHGCEDAGD